MEIDEIIFEYEDVRGIETCLYYADGMDELTDDERMAISEQLLNEYKQLIK